MWCTIFVVIFKRIVIIYDLKLIYNLFIELFTQVLSLLSFNTFLYCRLLSFSCLWRFLVAHIFTLGLIPACFEQAAEKTSRKMLQKTGKSIMPFERHLQLQRCRRNGEIDFFCFCNICAWWFWGNFPYRGRL